MSGFEDTFNDALSLRDSAYEAITERTSGGVNNMNPADILELIAALSRVIEGLSATVETFYDELKT